MCFEFSHSLSGYLVFQDKSINNSNRAMALRSLPHILSTCVFSAHFYSTDILSKFLEQQRKLISVALGYKAKAGM